MHPVGMNPAVNTLQKHSDLNTCISNSYKSTVVSYLNICLEEGEWRLHPQTGSCIWQMFGEAEVDLFASNMTTHCLLWSSHLSPWKLWKKILTLKTVLLLALSFLMRVGDLQALSISPSYMEDSAPTVAWLCSYSRFESFSLDIMIHLILLYVTAASHPVLTVSSSSLAPPF